MAPTFPNGVHCCEVAGGRGNWDVASFAPKLETAHVGRTVFHILGAGVIKCFKVYVNNFIGFLTCKRCTSPWQSVKTVKTTLAVTAYYKLTVTLAHATVKFIANVLRWTEEIEFSRAFEGCAVVVNTPPGT